MSVYWYLVCDDCKQKVYAGDSHSSGNFYLEEGVGKFLSKHPGHKLRSVPDPDYDTDVDVIEYSVFK